MTSGYGLFRINRDRLGEMDFKLATGDIFDKVEDAFKAAKRAGTGIYTVLPMVDIRKEDLKDG